MQGTDESLGKVAEGRLGRGVGQQAARRPERNVGLLLELALRAECDHVVPTFAGNIPEMVPGPHAHNLCYKILRGSVEPLEPLDVEGLP